LRGARVIDGLEDVDPAAWDRLVPGGSGGLRHGFLRAWERCELPGLRSRPLVIPAADGQGLLAAAAAYVYDLDLAAVHQLGSRRLVEAVRRAGPQFMIARVVELGSPVAGIDPLLVKHGADVRRAAGAIVDAALCVAQASGAGFTVVQDRVATRGPLAEALRARGFAPLRTLATAVLEHDYGSFEEYVADLRSKYRSRTRRIVRRSQHLRVERIDDFAALAPEFAALWRLVYERASETKREILGEPFFRAASALPEVAALVLRRPDRSIAAFGVVLEDAPRLHFLQCGFAVDAGRREAAYLRLLLEVVRAGIDGGFRRVELGCTTLGPKLDVGAVATPLQAWIRHRNGPLNIGCRLVSRMSQRAAVPAPRAVFALRARPPGATATAHCDD
jgi:predicted N-acyltransferase